MLASFLEDFRESSSSLRSSSYSQKKKCFPNRLSGLHGLRWARLAAKSIVVARNEDGELEYTNRPDRLMTFHQEVGLPPPIHMD